MSDLPLTSSATYLTVCAQLFSHDDDSAVPWSEACQDPLSVGFPRQEYWNLLPVPTPGDLPDPGIEPMSLASLALVGGYFTTSATWEAPTDY